MRYEHRLGKVALANGCAAGHDHHIGLVQHVSGQSFECWQAVLPDHPCDHARTGLLCHCGDTVGYTLRYRVGAQLRLTRRCEFIAGADNGHFGLRGDFKHRLICRCCSNYCARTKPCSDIQQEIASGKVAASCAHVPARSISFGKAHSVAFLHGVFLHDDAVRALGHGSARKYAYRLTRLDRSREACACSAFANNSQLHACCGRAIMHRIAIHRRDIRERSLSPGEDGYSKHSSSGLSQRHVFPW